MLSGVCVALCISGSTKLIEPHVWVLIVGALSGWVALLWFERKPTLPKPVARWSRARAASSGAGDVAAAVTKARTPPPLPRRSVGGAPVLWVVLIGVDHPDH